MDQAIVQYLKRAYSLLIGERTAEHIKIEIGSAYKLEDTLTMDVKGRDLMGGLPKTVTITSEEVREALMEPVTRIVEAVRMNLERCPPELSADLIDHGVMLAGGGALLRGLDRLVSEETGLPVAVADEPLLAVAKGTGIMLEEMDTLSRAVHSSAKRPRRM
jgi:rod shape-determining protein MreB